ncbi:eukaryotic translation initiation factor 3 subunit a [Quercus suber]|uniref:Eukaryotic translation initiation factor 3 subunit A n=1 Tax=Quercus suber TaxID=58331 RepID=A0AAW0LS65_QUESU
MDLIVKLSNTKDLGFAYADSKESDLLDLIDMSNFAKPENALKRAEELINVGQKQDALQTLHGLFTSRRHRAWQKPLERSMFKYIELCVDLRRGRFAKDGLIQYRIICQQVNVSSLEEVIKHFMHLSTERAEQARSQAQALEEALDVEDLEADKRPEDLMLSYVSGEKGKDRSDRELVTPWFKFLWETYRTVLEILRNNSKLEALYAMTAHRAFQFCKQYKRTTEFRRLCEIIRNHLANLNKYRDQRDRPDLSAPESLQLYLDTRFEQLKVATELQLWQEAFRSVEDIHGLMFMVKKTPKASLMLSRSSLLSELVAKGVMSCVIQEVKDLYHLLEHDFFPLDLASKVQPLLTKIAKFGGKLSSASSVPEVQFSQYVPSLEKLTTLRLLQQVSQVYQAMKIESLSRMIPFFDFSVVERISVDAVKNKFLASKVDHMKGIVTFDNMGLESEILRDHLTILAQTLNKARAMIYPPSRNASKLGELLPSLAETVDKEHKRVLARKSIIEKRKEEEERKLLEKERLEESKRIELQKITEEAERKRLAFEFEERKNERIRREIEERDLAEAQALLQEASQRIKWKGKKTGIEGEKLTKQSVMELTLTEQLRERQEMEKKLQKLAKTMDYLERAKREEAAPLVEAAYQQRIVEERALHEHEQQQEIELSKQRHDKEVKEKERLARIKNNKEIFQERVVSRRQDEFTRLRREREEQIAQILMSRRQEREKMRKMKFYLSLEEERQKKLREEEEAQKREEAERQRKEQAERQAKLDEIAEKQRQRERELEEKERLRREALLGRPTEGPLKPSQPPTSPRPLDTGSAAVPAPAAAAAAAAPSSGKYVPRFRRGSESSGQAPPPESDRWGSSSSRQDDRMSQAGDRWRSDDRRSSGGSSFGGGGGSRSTWSSSRIPTRGSER